MLPFFTTNDAEVTRVEGLYVKERNPPATISGVFLGTVGVCGECVRGPVDRPIEITSEARFKDVFGGRDQGSGGAIVGKVWKTLLNKKFGKLVVVRPAGAALSTPSAPVITQSGTAGSTAYSYKVVAKNAAGHTAASSAGSTATGNATLNGSNYNIVTWSAVTGATGYDVYRTVAAGTPSTLGLIGSTTSAVFLNDTGLAGDSATAPTTNTTAAAISTRTLNATATGIVRVDAANVGAWGNNVTMDVVVPSSDGVSGRFDLVLHYLGKDTYYKNLDVTSTNDNTLSVLGSDDANLVTITKLSAGTPDAQTGTTMTGGSEGSIIDSDFTASSRGINLLAGYSGVACVYVADRMSSALKTAMNTLASSASDRIFLVGADAETTTKASSVTEAASYRNQRVVYCFNHPYTLDPETATEILTRPEEWMASLFSQKDVDEHVGDEDSKAMLAGITRLYNQTYTRSDYIDFKAAGICALEKDQGFAFVSGVVTDLTPGKTEIARRRCADYLQLSAAGFLKYAVKKKNTASRRASNAGILNGWLNDLRLNERIVNAFQIDTEKLNTTISRAAGVERMLMRVQLIGHMLSIVLETEIGTGVSITQVQ